MFLAGNVQLWQEFLDSGLRRNDGKKPENPSIQSCLTTNPPLLGGGNIGGRRQIAMNRIMAELITTALSTKATPTLRPLARAWDTRTVGSSTKSISTRIT